MASKHRDNRLARRRAEREIARRHWDEYRALHAEEMAREPDDRTAAWYRARGRAHTRLALEHDAEFRRLLEKAKANVDVIIMRELKPCGTNAAYERHLRRGEPADAACRVAHNAPRKARWRAHAALSRLHPEEFERLCAEELAFEAGDDGRARDRARPRAFTRLARLHPVQFRELLDAEMAKEGLT